MKATIKHPAGKRFPSKFENKPNRINIVISLSNGEEIKIWRDETDPIANLQRGQTIDVFKNSKGEYEIDQDSLTQAPPVPTGPPTYTPFPKSNALLPPPEKSDLRFQKPSKETRQNMLDYIEFEAKLYSHCFDRAAAEMEALNLKDEQLQPIATTLFLGCMRKFGLQH